jgi:hypothetical protein
MNDVKPGRYDYRSRIQVPVDSPEAALLEYLKQERHLIYSHKEMVLSALRAYWLPFAYADRQRHGAPVAQDDLKRLAQDAIHRLKQQALYLQEAFGLEREVDNSWIGSNQLIRQDQNTVHSEAIPSTNHCPDNSESNDN